MQIAKWTLWLLILVLLGDRAISLAFFKAVEASEFRYSRMYREEEDCELLFAGNSRGLMFYQPYIEAATGTSTLNLSYNGMPMALADALIRDYLERHRPPKVLILDITLLDSRMDARLIPGFQCYRPASARLAALARDSFPLDFQVATAFHLYRYNSEVFQRALFYLFKPDTDWLLDRVMAASMVSDTASLPDFSIHFEERNLGQLAELAEHVRQAGVRVELVVNPYFPAFANKIVNLRDFIRLTEEATGLKVRDYSMAVQAVHGFGDYQHLNKQGARILVEQLVSDGLFE